jgi:hypothetical protein
VDHTRERLARDRRAGNKIAIAAILVIAGWIRRRGAKTLAARRHRWQRGELFQARLPA